MKFGLFVQLFDIRDLPTHVAYLIAILEIHARVYRLLRIPACSVQRRAPIHVDHRVDAEVISGSNDYGSGFVDCVL